MHTHALGGVIHCPLLCRWEQLYGKSGKHRLPSRFTENAVKIRTFFKTAQNIYLNWIFFRGMLITSSSFHSPNCASLATDHINCPTQLPGTKQMHLFRLKDTKRSSSPPYQIHLSHAQRHKAKFFLFQEGHNFAGSTSWLRGKWDGRWMRWHFFTFGQFELCL